MSYSEQKPNLHILMFAVLTAVSVGALMIRNAIIGDTKYDFLLWNLFLGFVPLATVWLIVWLGDRLPGWIFWCAAALWLLFYPNAPYMISDFIHVDQGESYVLYDALLIFDLAMLSTFFGLYSLVLIRSEIAQRYSRMLANVIVAGSIVLAAFGVYLGRVLRLNSWDVFTHPIKTFETIFGHLFPIGANPQTWALVLIFSVLQVFLLLLTLNLKEK